MKDATRATLLGLLSLSTALAVPQKKSKDLPPSLTYVDTEIESGAGRHCALWSVNVNEQNVAWPFCAEYVYDAAHTRDYILAGAYVGQGTCASWSVLVSGNRVIPQCSTSVAVPKDGGVH